MRKHPSELANVDEAPPGLCGRGVRLARAAMEGVVLLMVCLSPWAFGAVDAFWEFLLLAGVGVVLALWAAAGEAAARAGRGSGVACRAPRR